MKAKDSKTESVENKVGGIDQSVKRERAALDREMSAILKKDCRKTIGLWVSVAAGLKQYNLQRMYDVKFILNESYIRGVYAINNGKSITSHIAWLRATSYRVIQELSRQRQRQQDTAGIDALSGESVEEEEGETPRAAEHKRMRESLNHLSSLEQRILMLKIVHGLKWKAISALLAEEGHGRLKESALRQRKVRALKKLRDCYESVIS